MWRNCGEIKRKLRYNERKRKGSGCEADIYFSCAINEQSCEADIYFDACLYVK